MSAAYTDYFEDFFSDTSGGNTGMSVAFLF